MLLLVVCAIGLGCNSVSPQPPVSHPIHLRGSAYGGQQPLAGALVQLYAAGLMGEGSAATPLVKQPVYTDASGKFSLTALYICPSPDSFVYLTALGGNPGLPSNMKNKATGLMAALGPCGQVTDQNFGQLNETTAVGSAWPLAPFSKFHEGTPGAAVRYTTDETLATVSSPLYTAPFLLSGAETIRAVAVSGPLVSTVRQADYTVTTAPSIAVQPAAISLSAGQTQTFSAVVGGLAQNAVTWSLSPNLGTISAAGVYLAPNSIPAMQDVLVTAKSTAQPLISTSAAVTLIPVSGTTYHLAPSSGGGKDTNDGLSLATPWLTPKHPVRCGDVLLASPSQNYDSASFETGNWGTVTCPSSNKVAWLTCAVFDGCLVTARAGQPGFYVDRSFWGVQGWEANGNNPSANWCFGAAPSYFNAVTIHHVIFANNVANGCRQGGFVSFNSGQQAGVDYLAIIGNVAYNAAQNGLNCYSGISIYQPVASDTEPGTHLYAGGNIAYSNLDPSICDGGKPSDGEGLIFDTFDGGQGGLKAYTGQALAENNLLYGNGGRGLQVGNNNSGTGPFAAIFVRQNTVVGNNRDLHQQSNTTCGELGLFNTANTSVYGNLVEANTLLGCGAHPVFGLFAYGVDGSDEVNGNWAFSTAGNHAGGLGNRHFAYTPTNVLGQDPQISNRVSLSAPACAGSSNVPSCMHQAISSLHPSNPLAAGFGYQTPRTTSTYDPLFPHWLCSANLPPGLVTMGCAPAP